MQHLALLALAACTSSITLAQSHRIVLSEGEAVSGLGPISYIRDAAITNDGHVFTDVYNENTLVPRMILRNGIPYIGVGADLGNGYDLRGFERLTVDSRGGLSHLARVWKQPLNNPQAGVLRNGQLIIEPDGPCLDPLEATGFRDFTFSGRTVTPNQFLVSSQYFLPSYFWTDALSMLQVDDNGVFVSEEILHAIGQPLFAGGPTITRVARDDFDFAAASNGAYIWSAELDDGGGVSRRALVRGNEVVLLDGDPSGIPGAVFDLTFEAPVAIHESGDWAARVELEYDTGERGTAIVKNGEVLYRTGDVLPATSPYALNRQLGWWGLSFTDEGDLLWVGAWEGPGTPRAMFMNDQPILTAGETEVDGQLLKSWAPFPHPYLSPDSSRLATRFEVDLGGGNTKNVVVETRLDTANTFCDAVDSSLGRPVTMAIPGSPAVSDNNLVLRATGVPEGSFIQFFTSATVVNTPGAGGSVGRLCVGGAIGRYSGPGQIQQAGPMGRVELSIDLGAIPTPTGSIAVMPGETRFFQAWYRDSVNGTAVSNFSDGAAVTFE